MSYKIDNITIGSDPEIFIKDIDGGISSAIDLFGGTKDEPLDIGEGCFVQEDNILVEFNTPPCTDKESFIKAINYSKDYIETILIPLNKELHYSSSEKATVEILQNEKATTFGCASSYNVVKEKISDVDVDSLSESDKTLRSSGMHIHIGYENVDEEINDRLVLCFELFVTLPLLKKDNDVHNRRMLYGKIGDSRDKPYGVECRSLGGYFLKDDDSIAEVWDKTMEAIKFANTSKKTNDELRALIKSCMNSEDTINLIKVEEVLQTLEIKEIA